MRFFELFQSRSTLLLLFVGAFQPLATLGLNVFATYGTPEAKYANLDLDLRALVAQTALSTQAGLVQARQIYEQGFNTNNPNANTNPTLQSLGTTDAPFTDFETFQAFAAFYGGNNDYAEQYLQAAFNPEIKSLSLGDRKAEFAPTSSNIQGRVRTVSVGVLVLRVWMAISSSLAHAVDEHQRECTAATNTNNNSTLAVDSLRRAYALYTGSEAEGSNPLGGYMMYGFAQEQAQIFGTTHGTDQREAPVNTEMMTKFGQALTLVEQITTSADCNKDNQELETLFKRMMGLLRVPVLQASLRIAYAFDEESEARSIAFGEAAALGMAAAGIVSECNPGFANSVFNDLNYGNQIAGSYTVIRGAFERHYECLNITCADIGGIITSRGNGYVPRGGACGNVQPVDGAGSGTDPNNGGGSSPTTDPKPTPPASTGTGSSSSNGPSTAIVVIVVLVILAVVAALIVCLVRQRRGNDQAANKNEETSTVDTPEENGSESKVPEVV